MIALGIAPGLHALGYSVLCFNGAARAELLDADVLHAGRGMAPKDALDIARRCRAHRLILDVVLSRNPPAIIVLGPQAEPKEPPEHVAIIRLGLMALGQAVRVEVADMGDPEALYSALGVVGSKGLAAKLRASVVGPSAVPRDRRILLATAAAVAGSLRAPGK